MDKTIKPKEATHFIMYLKEIKEDIKNTKDQSEPEIYNKIIKSIDNVKNLEELDRIDQESILVHTKKQISIDQLQEIGRTIIRKRREFNKGDEVFETHKSLIKTSNTTEEVGSIRVYITVMTSLYH